MSIALETLEYSTGERWCQYPIFGKNQLDFDLLV